MKLISTILDTRVRPGGETVKVNLEGAGVRGLDMMVYFYVIYVCMYVLSHTANRPNPIKD